MAHQTEGTRTNTQSQIQTKADPDTRSSGAQDLLEKSVRRAPIERQLQMVRPAAPVQFAGSAQAVHQAASHGISGSPTTLPHAGAIQQSFGRHSVGGIQAFTDNNAQEANTQMGSMAYATGNSVAFKGAPD
ncbi:MAG: hypothetical protein AAFS10_26440, partial [Myxococcota bacterium]